MKAGDGSLDTREYPCLLRATNGDDIKFSTTVSCECHSVLRSSLELGTTGRAEQVLLGLWDAAQVIDGDAS